MFSVGLFLFVIYLLPLSPSLGSVQRPPKCTGAYRCREQMRNLVFKEIMEKIKPKTPSYDCHLEYAALHKFSLNDEDFFRFVVGDVKYTHAMIFNKTMYWEDFQVADVKEAVNSWSETLKGIKDPKKFGCNYYEAEDHVTYIRRKVLVCLFN